MANGAAGTVNTATAIAFAVAGIFAVGDWLAKARGQRTLEYVCKPATLVALVIAACVLDPAADAHTRRAWFVVALVFCLAGDVLLMVPRDLFVGGLAAFLLGHLCYVAGFWTHGPALAAFAVSGVAVAAVVLPLARRILGALARQRELRPPVVAYMVVISLMLASAIATRNPWAAVGAALFVWSDSMIAWDRFVRPFRWAPVAIMVTYHLGQAGLVVSLLR